MSKEHVYKLKYDMQKPEAGEFTAEDLRKEGVGGTDALLLMSIIYPEDGSLSTNFWTFDGRNKGEPLSDSEVFKMWVLIGRRLASRGELDAGRTQIANMPAEVIFGDGLAPLSTKEAPRNET